MVEIQVGEDDLEQLPNGLDASAWLRLCSLFNCCGASVEVVQVFSVEQLAVSGAVSTDDT